MLTRTLSHSVGWRLMMSFLFAACSAAAADPQLHVDEAQAKKAAIDKPAPLYPPAARQLKVAGTVHLEAVVADDGAVEEVRVVDGNSILTKAAVEAVKKWRFRPFALNGAPARAIVALSFEFGAR